MLVLSQYVETRFAAELLGNSAGGVGYLLKDRVAEVEEFLDALERIASGGTAFDPEVVRRLLSRTTHTNQPAGAAHCRVVAVVKVPRQLTRHSLSDHRRPKSPTCWR